LQIQKGYDPLLANGTIISILKNKYDFTQVTGASVEEIAAAVETAMENFLTEEREALLEETFQALGYVGKGEEVV
jgi:hypothetical protein